MGQLRPVPAQNGERGKVAKCFFLTWGLKGHIPLQGECVLAMSL